MESVQLPVKLVGTWMQFRGEIRKQWAKLNHDDLEYVAGERDKMIGRLQTRFGKSLYEAEIQADELSTRRPN